MSRLPRDEARLAREVVVAKPDSANQAGEFMEQTAVALMLQRNKVTHVYEMVRAYGTRPQIEYDRAARTWERTRAIRAKHMREDAVKPQDGLLVRGPSHAPLIYDTYPRTDTLSDFQASLAAQLKSADEMVVRGWLRADREAALDSSSGL
jgi:hypothetical protein